MPRFLIDGPKKGWPKEPKNKSVIREKKNTIIGISENIWCALIYTPLYTLSKLDICLTDFFLAKTEKKLLSWGEQE